MTEPSNDFLAELSWRGLLHQTSDDAGLAGHLVSGRRRGYVGFDPTADSLTIGNLVVITLLQRLERAGHEPVVVMGGGTGMIGDPGGKSAERPLLSVEQIEANVIGIRRIFDRLLPSAPLVNNLEWLSKLGYIELLRDIGKLFSVNAMVARDSVKSRLEGAGISYTEFSYMVLQAYDFAYLHEHHGVTLQMGGSDQWGNIVSGVDLIRRRRVGEAYALTLADVIADVPTTNHRADQLSGEGYSMVDVLAEGGVVSSRRQARQDLESGSISVNGERVGADRRLVSADLLHGSTVLIRRGKKTWHATRWS